VLHRPITSGVQVLAIVRRWSVQEPAEAQPTASCCRASRTPWPNRLRRLRGPRPSVLDRVVERPVIVGSALRERERRPGAMAGQQAIVDPVASRLQSLAGLDIGPGGTIWTITG
jgi:hypothetical protein